MSIKKGDEDNLIKRITDVWERDIRGTQIGCYSVAIIGLAVALQKVRPFSKFKRSSDIPNHFIREKRELTGTVKRIEPSGALLMIQHKPLLNLPFVSNGELPVKVSGLDVKSLGISWLQTVVAGNEVKFVPVLKEKDFVQCEVFLPQIRKKKVTTINVGASLLKVGFADINKLQTPLIDDLDYLKYYNTLKSAEQYALRKKMGPKYYVKPTIKLILNIIKQLKLRTSQFLTFSTKQISKVPHIVSS